MIHDRLPFSSTLAREFHLFLLSVKKIIKSIELLSMRKYEHFYLYIYKKRVILMRTTFGSFDIFKECMYKRTI